MKKQIMSLVLLAAVLGSTTAMANSDVPDNMLSLQARSAVDILTKNGPKGPYDGECSLEQLKMGCDKILMSNMALIVNLNIPEGKEVELEVIKGSCNGLGEVTYPNKNRVRLYSGLRFNQSGFYRIDNQSYETCPLQLRLK